MLGYAEIHYRPRGVPSLLYRPMPEIVTDAPTRVEPGNPVPVFVIIKDAHLFPVTLSMVVVHLVYDDGFERVLRFPYTDPRISEPMWWDAFNIVPERPGSLRIRPHVVVKPDGGKTTVIVVDNYRGVSHGPLVVRCADQSLPGAPGWLHGDIHCHSEHTADQVEFGAPVEALTRAAAASGLDWLAVTDHSYDLDDRPGAWIDPDPDLTRWANLRSTVADLNGTVTVIPGEEVSCRTAGGRTAHMLALAADRFIPGSGDGGERGLDTATEHSIVDAVRLCREAGGIPIAAHPHGPVPLMERLVLGRGAWTDEDFHTTGLSGMQILNGVRDRGFTAGHDAWISRLLVGDRIAICGGSDTHGDMNRRRRISFPLLWIRETLDHTLGCDRTVVRSPSRDRADILAAIDAGRTVVSDGPFIRLTVGDGSSTAEPGDTISGTDLSVSAECLSTREFGRITSGIIRAGDVSTGVEYTLALIGADDRDYRASLTARTGPRRANYVRAECRTESGSLCITNPVWIDA